MRRIVETMRSGAFWLGFAQFSAICIGAAAIIWLLSANARREIDALARANSDSVQWSLAQSEVEFRSYVSALQDVLLEGQGEAQQAKKMFDVFYARVQTLLSATTLEEVRAMPGVAEHLVAISTYLDNSIPIIDGGDANLAASAPDLLAAAKALQEDIRAISLAGVRAFAAETHLRRESVAGTLLDLGLIMFFLLAIVFAAVAVQLRMMRAAKRQTKKIIGTQNRLSSIISTSLDGILAVDREGKVLEFNGAAERIFGYSRGEAIGADMAELIIPDQFRAQHSAGMKRYLETGEKRVVGKGLVKLEAKDKSGRIFPVEFSISTADSPTGEIFVSYIRDISNRVRAETELIEARDKAVAGEKAKADLLAVMSHEMRTPLNGVLGTLNLLKNTDLNTKQRQLIEVMDQSGQLLLEHVNDVLDISRVDAGMAEVTAEDFKPLELVESVVGGLKTQARSRGNNLEIKEIGSPVGRVSGDKTRIRQILFNLLGNANKFTEQGKITVEIEPDPASDNVCFRVIDTGIGIKKDDLGRIFEDFTTLDTSYTREVEGTGLGLGIVRRLVALLDGEIGVESEVGKGSTFWVKLPLPGGSRRVVSRVSQPRFEEKGDFGLEVLVVEDNEINRMIIRAMLEQEGCRVVEANDGQEGVEAADLRKFDLILMDISMPRIDGLTATKKIRSSEGPNADTRIVALTAHAFAADVQRFRDAGLDEVLTKPLAQEELRVVLRESPVEVRGSERSQIVAELISALGPDLAREMQEKVKNEIGQGLANMQGLVLEGAKHSEIAALAHKLAGSAGVVGLDRVRSELLEIEKSNPKSETDQLLALVSSVENAIETSHLI